jgi:Spy/CpxP family protein refolding chaperone
MKKAVIFALMFAFVVGSAVAQQQGGPGSSGGGKGQSGAFNGSFGNPVDRMIESLGLDEAQAAAISLIFEENQLLREEQREQARIIAEEMRENTHTAILEILTPEQAAIFEAQAQEREAFRQKLEDLRFNGGLGGRRGAGTGTGNGTGTGDCMQ